MKFAHLADLHLGSWKEENMRKLSSETFIQAMEDCIKEEVDFILFSGDLFNTSLPSLDVLKTVTGKLKEMKERGINIYVIAGSHDFSPSGKTMIEVLESAGLLKNVCKGTVDQESKMLQLKFTLDEKTGAKITGMLGRKGQLDQTYYECLDLERLEKEEGPKIFLFHTSVAEMLPKEMSMIEAQPLSSFPKGFDYYAGGHIHIPTKIERERDRPSVYPGALFPNNLQELEKFPYGSYFLAEFSREGWKIEQKKIELFKLEVISPECNGKTPDLIEKEIKETLGGRNLENTLVIIRLEGKLKSGKATDINLKLITEMLELQGAYLVMRNTSKLVTEEYEEVMLAQSSPEETEEKIINEHLQQMKVFGAEKEKELIKGLLQAMNTSKKEGETNPDFQKRVEEEAGKMMGF